MDNKNYSDDRYSIKQDHEIPVLRKIRETRKAALYSLRAQTIKGMKVKSATELWVPFYAHVYINYNSGDLRIQVNDWFWKRLTFVENG